MCYQHAAMQLCMGTKLLRVQFRPGVSLVHGMVPSDPHVSLPVSPALAQSLAGRADCKQCGCGLIGKRWNGVGWSGLEWVWNGMGRSGRRRSETNQGRWKKQKEKVWGMEGFPSLGGKAVH